MAALPACSKRAQDFLEWTETGETPGRFLLCRSVPSTFNDLGDLGLVGVKLKGCEEAQGAQVEGHDWRDALL